MSANGAPSGSSIPARPARRAALVWTLVRFVRTLDVALPPGVTRPSPAHASLLARLQPTVRVAALRATRALQLSPADDVALQAALDRAEHAAALADEALRGAAESVFVAALDGREAAAAAVAALRRATERRAAPRSGGRAQWNALLSDTMVAWGRCLGLPLAHVLPALRSVEGDLGAALRALPAPPAPFAWCAACPAPCRARPAGEAVARSVTPGLRTLLRGEPDARVRQRLITATIGPAIRRRLPLAPEPVPPAVAYCAAGHIGEGLGLGETERRALLGMTPTRGEES